MNVSELLTLTLWVQRNVEQGQISQKYQELHTIVHQNARTNQGNKPFEQQKNALCEALISMPLKELTNHQLEFLDSTGILSAVGQSGVDTIEDVLFRNALDLATAAQKLAELKAQIDQGVAKVTQIREGLKGCEVAGGSESHDHYLMRVSFAGNAALENVVDFKAWGSTWYDIGRGVAMAHDEPPESIKVVGATKGSIVVELAVIASIATTTSGIILAGLKVAEKVLDIRKKAEEIRGMKLKNDKLAQELKDAANTEKEEGINQITVELSAQLQLNKGAQGDKIKALDTAVKNLVSFVENGGTIDFIAPTEVEDEAEENEADREALQEAFQEIRALEKKLESIEYAGSNK